MTHLKILLTLVFTSAATISCATAPAAPKETALDQAMKSGGKILDHVELISDTGVTYAAVNGEWFNFLSSDGRKVVKIVDGGLRKDLTWRINDEEQFCQQMFATEEEECDNTILIQGKDGIVVSYTKGDGKAGAAFNIISGNPENL